MPRNQGVPPRYSVRHICALFVPQSLIQLWADVLLHIWWKLFNNRQAWLKLQKLLKNRLPFTRTVNHSTSLNPLINLYFVCAFQFYIYHWPRMWPLDAGALWADAARRILGSGGVGGSSARIGTTIWAALGCWVRGPWERARYDTGRRLVHVVLLDWTKGTVVTSHACIVW